VGNTGKKRKTCYVSIRKLKERDHLEDRRGNGRLLKWNIQIKKWDGVEWINLGQYMDAWRELVNAVLNIPVP